LVGERGDNLNKGSRKEEEFLLKFSDSSSTRHVN